MLSERWATLPPELKTPNQISGRHMTHCGFTLGASYCSFHCTHCYLPKNANEVPIPSLADMKEMVDANRRFQGPGGGLQLTGGDVADAYWRSGRQDELVEIVRYTCASGLVPMLMTHGQTLIEHPEFLERLMVEGGLRQVAVHIDMTQAGRHGFPIGRVKSEADLHPVREAFSALGWRLREKTGLPLEFAHNCTVARRNIDGVAEIVRWFLDDPRRTQLWRMLSFQPEADTGRTIFSEQPITPTLVWEKICAGTKLPLRRDVTIFGHPDCNSWSSLLVSRRGGEYCALLPDDPKWDGLLGEVLARLAVRLADHLAHGKIPRSMLPAIVAGEVHTVGIGIHNFMDAAMVARADRDPTIKSRLDSCVFKGAVKQDGEWTAVPMCKMNEAKWAEVYERRLRDNAILQSAAQTRPHSSAPSEAAPAGPAER